MYHPLTPGALPSTEVKECILRYENKDIEDIYKRMSRIVPFDKQSAIYEMAKELANVKKDFALEIRRLSKKYKILPRKNQVRHMYRKAVEQGEICSNAPLERFLVTKAAKSQSGVLVITVLTSPTPMSNGKRQTFFL